MFVFVISNFMKSCTVHADSLCGKFMHVCSRSLSQWSDLVSGLNGLIQAYRTLKSLQIYLLTTDRNKTFRRIFSYKFGCRKKTLSDFLASRSSPSKTVNTAPGNRLKHRLKLYALRLRIFRDTLILVFVNENCCLCKCFTELHFFYWLLVVSYNFNRFAVCFQSFINNACRSILKMLLVSNAF